MRYSVGFAVLSLVVLAGCAAPDTKPPAAAVSADAQPQQTATATVKKPKTCIVGTRVCSKDQEVDPSVQGMSGDALDDSMRSHPGGFHGLP